MILFGNTKAFTQTMLSSSEEPIVHIHEALLSLDKDYMGICRELFAVDYLYQKEGCLELVQESVSDILTNIKNWVRRFKDFIIELFRKLFVFVDALFMDAGRFIDKYKDKLNLKNSFEYSLYSYDTDLMNKCPNLDPFNKCLSEFNNFSNLKTKSVAEFREAMTDFVEESNLSALRGKILGNNQDIRDIHFTEEVRKAFRKGKETEDKVEIDQAKAQQIIHDFKSNRNLLSKAKQDKNEILSMMDRVKDYFDKGGQKYSHQGTTYYMARNVSTNKNNAEFGENQRLDIGGDSKEKMETKLHNYFLLYFTQIKHISSITSTILTEKVNAIKEMIAVHGKVAKRAITESMRSQKKEGDEK